MGYSANTLYFPDINPSRVKYNLLYNDSTGLYYFDGKAPEVVQICDEVAPDVFFDSSNDYTPIEFDPTTLDYMYGAQIFIDHANAKNLLIFSKAVTGQCLLDILKLIKAPDPFAIAINTALGSTSTFTLATDSSGTYDCTVDWGDGEVSMITAYDDTAITHTYASDGSYTISIYGTFTHWTHIENIGDAEKVTAIISFGDIGLEAIGYGFYQCTNASGDIPSFPDTLTQVGTYAFRDSSFTGVDLTGITEIGYMAFRDTTAFTGDLIIPESVTSISTYAFYNSNIDGDIIYNTIIDIPNSCFSHDDILKNVYLTNWDLENIGVNAFSATTIGEALYIYTPVAPELGSNALNLSNSPELHVPVGALDYDTEEWTSAFSNIIYDLPNPFVFSIDTSLDGTTPTYTLPLSSDGTYDFVVDWGDDTTSTITAYDQADITHTYAAQGTYDITIEGTLTKFFVYESDDYLKLTGIEWFGYTDLTFFDRNFRDCSNLAGVLPRFPSGTTTIEAWSFYKTAVTGVDFTGITRIESTAFYDCTGIWGDTTIPDTVTTYQTYPFGDVTFDGDFIYNVNYQTKLTYGSFVGMDADSIHITYDKINYFDSMTFTNANIDDVYLYMREAPTLEDTNCLAFTNSPILHVRIHATGYDTSDWTDAFSSILYDIPDPLEITIDTSLGTGSTFTLPVEDSTTIDFTVDWGDGSTDTITSTTQAELTHTYASDGIYNLSMNGTFTSWYCNGYDDGLKITSVDSWGNVGLTSMLNAFRECTNLATIAKPITGMSGVSNFKRAFNECSSLTTLPDGFFDECPSITILDSTFSNSGLTSLPDSLLINCSGLVNMSAAFYGTSITEIPDKFLEHNPDVQDISSCFSRTPITSIPDDLLKYSSELTTAAELFAYTDITSVPSDLFEQNVNLTTVSYCFRATDITELPSSLFSNNVNITSFGYMCYTCSNLTSIPSTLFSNNTAATNFSGTFYNSGLESIPTGLFDNNTAATDFIYTFAYCTSVTSIPSTLFYSTTQAENFMGCFQGSGITSIPIGLFALNTNVTSFSATFRGTDITSIPNGLFTTNTKVTTFEQTFRDCTSLTSIPSSIFNFNTEVTTFYYTFYNCSSLTGNSDELWLNPSGASNYTLTSPDYDSGVPNGNKCYRYCTGLDDYDSIPDYWK